MARLVLSGWQTGQGLWPTGPCPRDAARWAQPPSRREEGARGTEVGGEDADGAGRLKAALLDLVGQR